MRVIFDKPLHNNPGLFEGQAWMDAAEAWAMEQGLVIVQWSVDQRFRASVAAGNEGRWPSLAWRETCPWYAITWQEGVAGKLGTWEVREQSKNQKMSTFFDPGRWTKALIDNLGGILMVAGMLGIAFGLHGMGEHLGGLAVSLIAGSVVASGKLFVSDGE
jgi:hypothetical protein